LIHLKRANESVSCGWACGRQNLSIARKQKRKANFLDFIVRPDVSLTQS